MFVENNSLVFTPNFSCGIIVYKVNAKRIRAGKKGCMLFPAKEAVARCVSLRKEKTHSATMNALSRRYFVVISLLHCPRIPAMLWRERANLPLMQWLATVQAAGAYLTFLRAAPQLAASQLWRSGWTGR